MEIDYKKAYNEALERAKRLRDSKYQTMNAKRVVEEIFPVLAESEDERIRKAIVATIEQCPYDFLNPKNRDKMLAYLEKQKDASKAIEAVDRIDKYIDEHVANAHDMKDSNPDKKYYLGWDDALAKMSGILQDVYSDEKQKESLHIPETCKENADSFTDACKDVIVAIEKYLDWLTGYPDYAPKGKYSLRDMLHCLYVLEKQKEQTSDIILKAFENSKTDYSLEEREEASDYSEKVLPTSIACGESDEEFLLHKVIEAAYIAGQKEPKPAEWSKEDKDKLYRIIETLLADKAAARQETPKHYDVLCEAYDELISWLKSIRPQSHWKPSEEQMDALNYAIAEWDGGKKLEGLYDLRTDLKKLM